MALLIGVSVFYYFVILLHKEKQLVSGGLNNDMELQTKCADRADFFFKLGGNLDNSQGFSSSYTNHLNKKLGKCFIQIRSDSLNGDNFVSINLYDAFEGKDYASFTGYTVCDPMLSATNSYKKCQLDSGNI